MSQRKTQRERLLAVLIEARHNWVPLPVILELKISQFGARIKELRGLGFNIRNKTEIVSGVKHSWYRLEPNSHPEPKESVPGDSDSPSMFARVECGSSRLDYEMGRTRGGR